MFSRYYQKLMYETISILYVTLCLKLSKVIFCEDLWSDVFGPKGSQNEPKIRLFKFSENLMLWIFLVFCVTFQQHKDLKLTHMIFPGKLLHRNVWTKTGPKRVFFSRTNKCIELFCFFAWSCKGIDIKNWVKSVLIKLFWGSFLGKKLSKWAQP